MVFAPSPASLFGACERSLVLFGDLWSQEREVLDIGFGAGFQTCTFAKVR